jgi:hypothetical protein
MSSQKPSRNLRGKKTEPSSDLSRHYREIGIKAVASATGDTRHRARSSTAAEGKHETKHRTKEDTDE